MRVICFSIFFILVSAISIAQSYTAKAQIEVTPQQSGSGVPFAYSLSVNDCIEKIRSKDLLEKVARDLKASNQTLAVQFIKSNLSVIQDGYKLNLKYTGKSNAAAVQALDLIIQYAIEDVMTNKHSVVRKNLDFFDAQMDQAYSAMAMAEDELLQYMDAKGILNLEKEEALLFERYDSIDKELVEKKQQVDDMRMVVDMIHSSGPDQMITIPTSIAKKDKYINDVAVELYSLYKRAGIMTDSLIVLSGLYDQIAFSKKNLLMYLNTSKEVNIEKIKELQEKVHYYQSYLKAIPSQKMELKKMEMKLEAQRTIYKELLVSRGLYMTKEMSSLSGPIRVSERPR